MRFVTELGDGTIIRSVVLALALAGSAPNAFAQNFQDPGEVALEGSQASAAEREAFNQVEEGHYVRARELAERILKKNASSSLAQMVLAFAQHYGEDNLPRALFHLDRALALYERRYGGQPGPDAPWRWHAAILRELAEVHGDMEHHAEKLAYIARYNLLYDPDMVAERAWPLMKLGRHREARLAADLGLQTDRVGQRVIALNALCAIEFEAGNDGQSYDACRRAIEDGYQNGGVSAVDLTNFAEASRSLFKLDEAERISLEATTAAASWYGNPWMDLAELYVRQGRFGETLSALKQVPEYRMKRPPHARDADRNEMRRALASFLLMLSKPEQAYEVTGRALAAPERRAHNSRDPAQDRIVLALLDRRARRVQAELVLERGATEPWYKRPLEWGRALALRFAGRESGALVERMLADEERLVGSFRVGTARSAVMPPWLLGELCDVVGEGVVQEALTRARKRDHREGAGAYYDAVEAEVAFGAGDAARAEQLALRAQQTLGTSEVLLIARVLAIAAEAERSQGKLELARARYDAAFQRDPGIFRRLELSVPVEISSAGGAVAEEAAEMLARSPRFTQTRGGLGLSVRANGPTARVCLSAAQGAVINCAEITVRDKQPGQSHAQHIAQEALRQLFAPRIDLSQMDINSLDGQNLSGRDALKTMFE
jgi:tetratricopeptide (TPR) repeat protein